MNGLSANGLAIRDNFTDLNSLDSVKRAGRQGDTEALREVARQFESMFVRELLKTMRATEDIFAEGNYNQSNEMQFHRDLLDQQLSLSLTQGQGLGLGEALYRQLVEQYGKLLPTAGKTDAAAEPAAASPRAADPAQPAATATPVSTVQSDSPTAFIDSIFDPALSAAENLGVAVEGILAQAALETGWGKALMTRGNGDSSFNLFNIKAGGGWQGDTVQKTVLEYDGARAYQTPASFRAYEDLNQAFEDFTRLLTGKTRYAAVLGQSDAQAYGAALQQAGYATDPDYGRKIAAIASRTEFKDYVARKLQSL